MAEQLPLENRSSAETITIQLSLVSSPSPSHTLKPDESTIHLPRSSSIQQLKQHLQRNWSGKPKEEGIVCVLGGRTCRDSEVLADLFPVEQEKNELNIIVKASAWQELPPSSLPTPTVTATTTTGGIQVSSSLPPHPALSTAVPAIALTLPTPAPTPTPSPSIAPLLLPVPTSGYNPAYLPTTPTASLGPTITGYPTFLSFLSQLIPLQRALLLLNLQKALFLYEGAVERRARSISTPSEAVVGGQDVDESEEWSSGWDLVPNSSPEGEGEVRVEREQETIKGLLIDCGLWGLVREAEEEGTREWKDWGETVNGNEREEEDEFQVVQIGNQPFILHLPPALLTPPHRPPLPILLSFKRAQTIHQVITTMLQLLITYQPTSPAVAYGRALLRPASGSSSGGGAAPVQAAPAQPAAPQPRRRATLSIIINLEALLSLLVPLFLLSLKLGFLLWIFGRHASWGKRVVMGVLAVGWVVWEGWGMQQQQPGHHQPAAAPGEPLLPLPADAPVPPAPRPRHRHTSRTGRPPVSRLTPRYWLNWVAAIGLASEARELGLVPRSIAGRPVSPSSNATANQQQQQLDSPRRRALRTAMVAIVLFFGTLSPEVEKKRKRALEKRERLLRERRERGERKALEAALAEREREARMPDIVVEDAPVEGQGRERRENRPPPGVVEMRAQGLAPANGTASGTSTPGVFEVEEDLEEDLGVGGMRLGDTVRGDSATAPSTSTAEATPSMSGSGLASSSGAASTSTPVVEPNPSSSSRSPSPLQGRQLIPDAELFADGLGEPDQPPLPLSPPTEDEELLEDDGEDDGEGDGGPEEEGEVEGIVALF
ncbi:hypothetical protein T439DRAFT_359476 [Meredithblackwellia eburnea MCA 4105]